MEILYLKGYKWLLSQNKRIGIDFLGYRRYKALAKHIKPFLKTLKSKDVSARTIIFLNFLTLWSIHFFQRKVGPSLNKEVLTGSILLPDLFSGI